MTDNKKMMELPMRQDEIDHPISLNDFFEKRKDHARRIFLQHGELPPMVMMLSEKEGDKALLTQVICEWDCDAERRGIIKCLKAIIAKMGNVEAYCFIAEGWASEGKSACHPSKDPDRIEILQVSVKERDNPQGLFTIALIQRNALSPKPSLGEWEVGGTATGPFLELFDDDNPEVVHELLDRECKGSA
jgi:hypothetical protein